MSHQIRLAGPWEFSIDGAAWERCTLPFPESSDQNTATGIIRRRFHRPTGLDDTSIVSIVITATLEVPYLELNGIRLSPTPSPTNSDSSAITTFDVTRSLIDFNVLVLPMEADHSSAQQISAVSLKIAESPSSRH